MMPGPTELMVILVVALIILGSKKLPELGRSLGGGMKSFKDSVSGNDAADEPKPCPRRRPDRSAGSAQKHLGTP